MTDRSQPDSEKVLNTLLAAAAEFARVTIAGHEKEPEIVDRFGDNIVLGVDLARASVALSGRNPGGELTFILGAQRPGAPKLSAEEHD
jgi:hypothetical protein